MAISFFGKLWNPIAYSGASHAEAAPPQPSAQWKVKLGKAAEKEGLHTILKRASFNYHLDPKYKPPSPSELLEVTRNRSVLLDVKDLKPGVSNIQQAIIIELRTTDAQGNVSHLGLAHLATRIDALKETLNKMLDQPNGEVEIFIAGGTSSSDKLYQSVRQYIESVQKVHRGRVHLRDDYFKAADLKEWLPKEDCPSRKLEVAEAGFDQDNQPFMILDHPTYESSS